MIFTKEIENTPEEIVLSMEDAELALMDAEFDLAMEDFNMYRANYDAEILAIEAYVKADKNLELCTESFNVIKEGFSDKMKELGSKAWEAIKKLVNALIEKLKSAYNFIKNASTNLKNTIDSKLFTTYHNVYDIDDYKKAFDKVYEYINKIRSKAEPLAMIRRFSYSKMEVGNTWDVKKYIYKANIGNPPFSDDYNNINEMIKNINAYIDDKALNAEIKTTSPKRDIEEVINVSHKIIDILNRDVKALSKVIDNLQKQTSEASNDDELKDTRTLIHVLQTVSAVYNHLCDKTISALKHWVSQSHANALPAKKEEK